MTIRFWMGAGGASARLWAPLLAVLFALLLNLLLALGAGPARADNLVTLRTADLPAPPGMTQPPRLLALGERLLALDASSAWLLDAGNKTWQRQPGWTPPAGVVASASGAAGAVLLADAGALPLRLTLDGGVLRSAPLPALPVALRGPRAALLGDTLYVAGTDGAGALQLLALELNKQGAAWAAMPAWPGASGAVTSLAAQNTRVVATLADPAGGGEHLVTWNARKGWRTAARAAGRVLDGGVRATGQAHLLYLLQTAAGAELWTYHTITDTWARQGAAGVVGAPGAQLAGAAGWGAGLVWAAAGADGKTVFTTGVLEAGQRLLRPLDWVMIIAYLVGMLGIGWYYYAREKRNSTADFFVGGRSIPFWAAGISLYAANTSSISYIAIPAKAFETNWQYMTNNLIAVIALGFVAVAIVPLLRRLNLMSVFHYLEIRFHPAIRMLASLICILVQIGSRMSVILLLPSLAIATITGIDVTWSILMMGGFTIVYTAMGGMKAVVWTDFVQLIVKMGGALFAIGFIIWKLDGGVMEFVQTSMAEDKTRLFDFSWDLTQPTVWGFIFLVIFDVVLTFPKDQVLMQRALSTRSAPEATRSIITFALISIPGGFIFYTIGTALFAFYKSNPERMNPALSIDATFPLFIAAELPVGITGLIIAGILAAAMATLSGIMNSVATLASVDFYEKMVKNPTPKKSVLFAEVATVVTGLIGIAAALWLSRFNSHSLFDVSIELAGLLGGGFAGAYTLGMFTRRANWQGVALGIAGSTCLTTYAWSVKLVHPYFYLPVSIMLCIGIGYLASFLFPAPRQSLAGLTIYADK
ncbi:sodium:solute symporter [uncultured Massilia sp.]|uniref:sodium:solute symporter n=1 Tax=uncultured Massilia sp. TaxID=169973 RepID=UPI0025839FC0|nr:sodium:solute symporter [uncultured Massilia sp.]